MVLGKEKENEIPVVQQGFWEQMGLRNWKSKVVWVSQNNRKDEDRLQDVLSHDYSVHLSKSVYSVWDVNYCSLEEDTTTTKSLFLPFPKRIVNQISLAK